MPATTLDFDGEAEAWSALEQLTADDNYGVIAYIDADEVWTTTDDDAIDGGRALDHAVVVSHVDENYVYLNDPGTPDGMQSRIDRDQFMDAWADSGHQALVTDEPAPGGLTNATGGDALERRLRRHGGRRRDDVRPAAGPVRAGDDDGHRRRRPGDHGYGTGGSPLDLSLDSGELADQPWESSPDMGLLTSVLPGLRVAILPVVLGAGALVAVAASRRQQR